MSTSGLHGVTRYFFLKNVSREFHDQKFGKIRALGPTTGTGEKGYSGCGEGGAQTRPALDQAERKVCSGQKRSTNKMKMLKRKREISVLGSSAQTNFYWRNSRKVFSLLIAFMRKVVSSLLVAALVFCLS